MYSRCPRLHRSEPSAGSAPLSNSNTRHDRMEPVIAPLAVSNVQFRTRPPSPGLGMFQNGPSAAAAATAAAAAALAPVQLDSLAALRLKRPPSRDFGEQPPIKLSDFDASAAAATANGVLLPPHV